MFLYIGPSGFPSQQILQKDNNIITVKGYYQS